MGTQLLHQELHQRLRVGSPLVSVYFCSDLACKLEMNCKFKFIVFDTNVEYYHYSSRYIFTLARLCLQNQRHLFIIFSLRSLSVSLVSKLGIDTFSCSNNFDKLGTDTFLVQITMTKFFLLYLRNMTCHNSFLITLW